MMNLLEVLNLSIFFSQLDPLEVVQNISFKVMKGEAVGIVGESGSGKSSIAQAITRLSAAFKIEGKILFEGCDLLQQSEKYMHKIRGIRIGMIFQDPMTFLNPTMPIGKQIAEGLIHHQLGTKKEIQQRVLELLRQMEIQNPEDRLYQYPHQLSGGMRQRILLAIALSCRPHLLIADEPTTALDIVVQAQILKLLKTRDPSIGLLLITHDLSVVASVCDQVIVLHEGKIVEQGPTKQVLHSPQHPYTRMLLQVLPNTEISNLCSLI